MEITQHASPYLSSGVTKRSRHFAIEWFKVKDLVEAGEMHVVWTFTDKNIADFFTKKLGREKFELFSDLLMGNMKLQSHFNPIRSAQAYCEIRKTTRILDEMLFEVNPKTIEVNPKSLLCRMITCSTDKPQYCGKFLRSECQKG